jgi:hypothetical protein
MRRTTLALGLLFALVVAFGIAWASRIRMVPYPTPGAMLRLAWSARPERIEECRSPTADELASRPQHMRQERICEGRAATYRLEVRVDDALVVEQEVHGGGLRRDRRLYVFHELAVPPGESRIDVRFTRLEEQDSRSEPSFRAEFVPPRLVLEQHVQLDPREVVLVTYDADRRSLVAVQRPRLPNR